MQLPPEHHSHCSGQLHIILSAKAISILSFLYYTKIYFLIHYMRLSAALFVLFQPESSVMCAWNMKSGKNKPFSKWKWFSRPHFWSNFGQISMFIYINWNLEVISISETFHRVLYGVKLAKEATECMNCSGTKTPLWIEVWRPNYQEN